jgi:hypothetical protein
MHLGSALLAILQPLLFKLAAQLLKMAREG